MNKIKQPLVSVCMITYGHEKYILKAINGVLNQITNFPFELIIANDCSPDNTDQIIKNCIKTLPNGYLITYYNHDKNKGMMSNFGFALNSCTGKYIALCEGDDYWSDAMKLQKQVDFLENNKDFSLVGFNAKFNRNDKEIDQLVRTVPNEFVDFTTSDLIKKNPFVSSMVMIRNIGFNNIMSILDNFIVGDKALFTLLSFSGKCRIYSEPVGFYRKHENSVTSKNRIEYVPFRDDLINRINHAKFWNDYSGNKFNEEVKEVVEYRSKVLTTMALRNSDFKTAIHYSQFVNLKTIKKTRTKIIIMLLKLFS
ncbi:glycosyltransferase [Lacinutrix iliipiscaria]|uniref:Glycosyltransferase n=1 Tax=Lacinutrix iliipiscaria TaxID=1230532 RepID=A0ABW5WM42_9FLAO